MTIYLTYYCSASTPYDIKIYQGNTDYFDFSSAEMIAAQISCATMNDLN